MALICCRRGENWVWQEIKKDEEEERLASLTQGGILHFRNNEGVFKVIFCKLAFISCKEEIFVEACMLGLLHLFNLLRLLSQQLWLVPSSVG